MVEVAAPVLRAALTVGVQAAAVHVARREQEGQVVLAVPQVQVALLELVQAAPLELLEREHEAEPVRLVAALVVVEADG